MNVEEVLLSDPRVSPGADNDATIGKLYIYIYIYINVDIWMQPKFLEIHLLDL